MQDISQNQEVYLEIHLIKLKIQNLEMQSIQSFTSFGIYLCHMMIFVLFQYILTPLQDQNYFIYVNLVLILTIGISWFIIWVLSKIPHVNKISGAG